MKEGIIQLLRDACALPEEIGEDSVFSQLSLDSLTFIDFLVSVEDAFGIKFRVEDFEISNWGTLGEFIKTVDRYVEE